MNKTKEEIKNLLIGGDLRSIGKSTKIIKLINSQEDFDMLFSFIIGNDRLIAMRAADSIEKITRITTNYLEKHKKKIIELCDKVVNKELKWHLVQIVSRINLTSEESYKVFNILSKWILDKNESKIVRANSLQSLYEISKMNTFLKKEFNKIVHQIKTENVPSLHARIKKLGL